MLLGMHKIFNFRLIFIEFNVSFIKNSSKRRDMKIRMRLQTKISPHCENRTNMNPKLKTGPWFSNLWGNSIVVK